LSVVVPVTVSVPLSVIAPVEVTARFPVAVVAPKLTAPVAATVTFLPLRINAAVKALVDVPNVISFAPAEIVVVPVTVNLPVFVTAPDGVTDKSPPTVITPRAVALFEVIVRSFVAAVVAATDSAAVRAIVRSPLVPVTFRESAAAPPLKLTEVRLLLFADEIVV